MEQEEQAHLAQVGADLVVAAEVAGFPGSLGAVVLVAADSAAVDSEAAERLLTLKPLPLSEPERVPAPLMQAW